MGWLSINFDGSSKGNLGQVKLKGVVRDHMGKIKLIIVESLGFQLSHFVEARVVFINLSMLSWMNCINMSITRDSLNVINMLRGNSSLGWDIKYMIDESRSIINRIENFIIQHNYREDNKMVDYIIDETMNMKEFAVWDSNFTDHFEKLAKEDIYDSIKS